MSVSNQQPLTFGNPTVVLCSSESISHFYSFSVFVFSFVSNTVALGWVISLLSLISLPQIATHPEKFALMYTFGNILSLCSTAFLWGSVFFFCLRARPPARALLHCVGPASSCD